MTIALKQFISPAPGHSWFDVLLEDGDLVTDAGLESAVVLSLFIDRRAETDDVIDDDDKRGWWADGIDSDGDLIGSRLWLLQRSKTVADIPRRAKEYAEEALDWMREDGVAKSVLASAQRIGNVLSLQIAIARPDGREWSSVWEVQLNVV